MRASSGAILFYLATTASLAQAQPSSPSPEQVKARDPVERREAADLSGKWAGTLEMPRPGGGMRSQSMYLLLKQDGSRLVGSGGPDLGELDELTDGKLAGDKVSFDLHDDDHVLHARLLLEDDRLVGELSRDGRPALKLSFKRVSYPTAAELRRPLAEIDAMVAAAMAKRPIGSVTIGVVSGSQLIWSKSYGDADMEKKTPAARDTVYRIGSITKLFTALMLYQLVEDGKVHLSDPVEKYFPEVKKIQGRFPDAPPITLVQLATHTAGLSREPDDLPSFLKGPVSEWEKVLIAALPHTRYEFEPGTRHSYSNIGYAILGASLSRAIGQPYTESVRKRIFKPLGMDHSAFEPEPAILPTLSKGYAVEGGKVDSVTPQREHEGRGYKVPNGAIYVTVGDLGRFASFLLGEGPESVLKTASLERCLAQQPVQAGFELSGGYGRGFQTIRRESFTAFGHSGGVAGYQAALYMNRKAGVAVVVLANALGTPVDTRDLSLRSLDILSEAVKPPQRSERGAIADVAGNAPGAKGRTSDSAPDGIDDYIGGEMQKRHIPGVSVAIVLDGNVVCAKGYGLADVEHSVPATENTVYQLASVTKTFTATAIMMLVADGKLGLDDKISGRLPDLPTAWREVTVRHLLNHTSGIKSYTSVRDFFKTARKDYARREILDLVAKEPLEFTPGEKWNYSNTGYFLLGMLIEKVTGKSYGEFLDGRIFKPLGMTNTRVNDLHAIIPNRAQGYAWDGKVLRNGEYVSPTQPFAAGMLVSTASDLVKWDAALSTDRLLEKSCLERMWIPTPLAKGKTAGYGFGWEVDKANGHRLISHGGGIPGFSTQLSRFVDDKLTVIVLTNGDNGNAGALARGIAGRMLPALARKAEEPIADTDVKSTERLKGVLLGAMKGEADPETFTEESKKALIPRIKEGKDHFASFGALKTFQLLERKATDQGMRLRYRAVFENETVNAVFGLDRSGKIADLGLRPEE